MSAAAFTVNPEMLTAFRTLGAGIETSTTVANLCTNSVDAKTSSPFLFSGASSNTTAAYLPPQMPLGIVSLPSTESPSPGPNVASSLESFIHFAHEYFDSPGSTTR